MSDSTRKPQAIITTGALYPSAGPLPSGPILVATDGTSAGEAAFRAATAIAPNLHSSVQVMVVVEPLPVIVPEPSDVIEPLVASPALLNEIRDRVVAQLGKLAPPGFDLHVEVDYGRPSSEIADKARDRKAQLIVIGLVHHGVMDRILDGDTALEVVRKAHAPVLLAASDWRGPPKSAVFAVDFSSQSMQAARVGLRLLADGATIVLAHSRPIVTVYDGMGMWEEEYESAAMKELGKFADALNVPAGMKVQHMMLTGSPSATLLGLADRMDADLIVAGTQGAGLMQRLFVGSVATRLMRHSTRSLLIVPETAQ